MRPLIPTTKQLVVVSIALVLAGCSQSQQDYAAVRIGVTPHEQMTASQRKLERERITMMCIEHVHAGYGHPSGKTYKTMEACKSGSGFDKLVALDKQDQAQSGASKKPN